MTKPNEAESCNEYLAPAGSKLRTLAVASVLGVCCNFAEGFSNTYVNTAYLSFKEFLNGSAITRGNENGMTEESYTWAWSFILNVWHIGFAIGNGLIPVLTERYGRRKTLLATSVQFAVASVLITISIPLKLPELILFGRFVLAITGGISFGTLIIFLQETAPTKFRGQASFLAETTFLLNTVLGSTLGMDFVLGKNLILLSAIAIVPPVASLFIIYPLHETPKYLLLTKAKHKEAAKSVTFYYGAKQDPSVILAEISKEISDDRPRGNSILNVFREKHLRVPFLIGICSLQLVMALFPMLYLSTEFLVEMFTPFYAQIASVGFIACQFVSGICGMSVVRRFGRRPILLGLGAVNSMSFVLYVLFDKLHTSHGQLWQYGCIAAFCLFGVSYGLGLGPISCFITSELVSQRYRSLVQSMMFTTNTIITSFVSFVTLPAYRHFGCISFLFLFTIPSVLCLLYLYKVLPETKDREVHDIVYELRQRSGRMTSQVSSDVSLLRGDAAPFAESAVV